MSTNDTPLIRWPVYEPAHAGALALTESDLLQHLLVLGATGSGKTSVLHRVMAQLIAHSGDARAKIGLLICDAKQDDTVDRVRDLARQAGREDDVVVLGPEGDHRLDLFTLRSLADVDDAVDRLLVGSGRLDLNNAYWAEMRHTMLDAALTLLVHTEPRVRFGPAIEFMRRWFYGEHPTARLQKAQESLKLAPPIQRRKLQQALDTAKLWASLDPRTKSNVQSILLNATRPLLSVAAGQCFESVGRRAFNIRDVADSGRICVISANAVAEPALAGLLFKLVKRDFFDAVQRRQGNTHRLCGLIADEFPLLISPDDVEQLATVRAKRCFVAAASQGLISLDDRVGARVRRAVLINFGTLMFLRSREPEVDEFAAVQLGTHPIKKPRPPQMRWSLGSLYLVDPPPTSQPLLQVCPPGTLGRLAPHQAYVVLADGTRRTEPLWFVPWFEDVQSSEVPRQSPTAAYATDVMERAGHQPLMDLPQFAEMLKLCEPADNRAELLKRTTDFFRSKACRVPQGLEQLPSCWLKGLPGVLWSLRKPHWSNLPWMISKVGCEDGTLCLAFAQELHPDVAKATAWDALRVAVNLRLYPSRWRMPRPKHVRQLGWCDPTLRRPTASTATPIEPGSEPGQ